MDEALEKFAPNEKAALTEIGEAFNAKQNQFNKQMMFGNYVKNMLDLAKVQIDAANLGITL